jgi:hypothetical protein
MDAELATSAAELETSSPEVPLPESEPQPASKNPAANTTPSARKDLFISIPQKLSPIADNISFRTAKKDLWICDKKQTRRGKVAK